MHTLFRSLLLLAFAVPLASVSDAAPHVFHVAPAGDDAHPGTREKPFATLEAARDAIRAMRLRAQPGQAAQRVAVDVHGGTYFLKQSLVLSPEDSGTPDAPVIYRAAEGEYPVVSGGRPVAMAKQADGQWTATLPEVTKENWAFTRLSVNGASRSRPRLPATGYFTVAKKPDIAPGAGAKGLDAIAFSPGDIRAGWADLPDVEVLGFQIWTMARLRLAGVDEAAGIARFSGSTVNRENYSRLASRYLIDNVKEALTQPGGFYLDTKSGVLTYLPLPGEEPGKSVVVAPRLDQLLRFQGDAANRAWVHDIEWRGIAFAHSNWQTPPQGHAFTQADVTVPAAINLEAARNIALRDLQIRQTGGWGVSLDGGSKNNVIRGCALTDLGGGGIKIGGMVAPDEDDRITGGNRVEDCLLAHGGRLHPAATGIWIGHSPNNIIAHNEIADFYYTGISLGWSWGYGRSLAHDNEVAWNHIHQIGQGVLSDMGGIYTLGAGTGNRLHHNLIHDVEADGYGGWGIYFDEGTSGMTAEDNIVYRTKSSGFHQHYGKENTVRHNIFALGREAQLMRTRPEPDHFTLDIRHNIILSDKAPVFGANWSGNNFTLADNLYWTSGGEAKVFPGGKTLEQWQADGQDKGSRMADPLFRAPADGDFRLKPGSPAPAMGFQPLDLSAAGPRGKMPHAAALPPAFPVHPAAP